MAHPGGGARGGRSRSDRRLRRFHRHDVGGRPGPRPPPPGSVALPGLHGLSGGGADRQPAGSTPAARRRSPATASSPRPRSSYYRPSGFATSNGPITLTATAARFGASSQAAAALAVIEAALDARPGAVPADHRAARRRRPCRRHRRNRRRRPGHRDRGGLAGRQPDRQPGGGGPARGAATRADPPPRRRPDRPTSAAAEPRSGGPGPRSRRPSGRPSRRRRRISAAGDGAGEEEALVGVEALGLEAAELLLGLDALGDDPQPEVAPEGDQRRGAEPRGRRRGCRRRRGGSCGRS